MIRRGTQRSQNHHYARIELLESRWLLSCLADSTDDDAIDTSWDDSGSDSSTTDDGPTTQPSDPTMEPTTQPTTEPTTEPTTNPDSGDNGTTTAPGSDDSGSSDQPDQPCGPDQGTTSTDTTPLDTWNSLTISASEVPFGTPVTVSATVADYYGPVSGTVAFYSGSNFLAEVTLDGSGTASLSYPTLDAGGYVFSAYYEGDSADNPSTSNFLTLQVDPLATGCDLLSPPAMLDFGSMVTLEAQVYTAAGPLSGTVEFSNGAYSLGQADVDSSGLATLSWPVLLGAGTHYLQAQYFGDQNHGGSSSPQYQTVVDPGDSAVALQISSHNLVEGQRLNFSVAVDDAWAGWASAGGHPTGDVLLLDNGATLADLPLDNTGAATWSTTSLGHGRHVLYALYAGDANYNGSTSDHQTVLVQQNGSAVQVRLTTTAVSVDPGDRVGLIATVNTDLGPVVEGTLTIYDGTSILTSGTPDDNGQLGLWRSDLVIGTHHLSATYTQSPHFQNGAANALDVTVQTTSQEFQYIQRLYQTILGRAGDDVGLTTWTGALRTGRLSRPQIAWAFIYSDEYCWIQVNNLYQTILGRQPDTAGGQHWFNIFKSGVPLETVSLGFYGSDEYFQQVGGTHTTLIERYYQVFLGRNAEPEGLAHWMGLLDQGVAHGVVAQDIMNVSAEGRQVQVTANYRTYLGRDPDAEGLQYWMGLLAKGTPRITLEVGFITSQEFYQQS